MTMLANASAISRRAVVDNAAPDFALPLDRGEQSWPAKIGGKFSRFMARKVATKTLPMSNTRPLVTFTFDDAPESAYASGARLLEQYQARGTFYICGGGCG